ncbi:hypothetical protein [Candidatus Chlamydia sanziniae]|uniref:Uncharacterized protein n=1 Tax=Candidatus Chlamydia sanziniae TaxID=1806891 RepID=A0A1A9HW24_9CHLA|nr:hypothetical protein [Candidatus Chlamydia sanziniae]ANH78621.1 hypothetical protein Cs308_0450 [Candidatus Chlamydia sanziniae]
MQPYIFTLLCLSSLLTLVAFDAANARKRCVCAQALERSENLFHATRSACAEIAYQEKATRIAAIERISKDNEEAPNKVCKAAKVATKKKQRYRLLQVPFSRPPNNSRYNLYALLTESPADYQNPTSWYAIFVRLLKHVYVDTGYVSPGSEYVITEALIHKKEEILLNALKFGPDIIETLTLPTEEAEILYKMLRGSAKTQSLLNFLHYEETTLGNCKLNLIFMDSLLLEAVINHPIAYQEIAALRNGIWDTVKRQELAIQEHGQAAALELFKTRTDFRLELRDKTQVLLSRYDLLPLLNKKLFDYTLGSAGDYLFLVDPESGTISRCLCSSRNKL